MLFTCGWVEKLWGKSVVCITDADEIELGVEVDVNETVLSDAKILDKGNVTNNY